MGGKSVKSNRARTGEKEITKSKTNKKKKNQTQYKNSGAGPRNDTAKKAGKQNWGTNGIKRRWGIPFEEKN